MTHFAIVVGPNANDGSPIDYLRRLERAVEDYLIARRVAYDTARRAAAVAVNTARESRKHVVYLTENDVWRFVQAADADVTQSSDVKV